MEKKKDKLAVYFPGIGYHKDKPLLYYSSRLLNSIGYQNLFVEYHDLPAKVKGNREMMRKAFEMAYVQAAEQLSDVDFESFSEIIFVGKSIGTVVAAKYAIEASVEAKQVWYTPVEDTFSFAGKEPDKRIISFLGDADPWSDVDKDKQLAETLGIRLYSYPDCNHSLETEDALKNIEILKDVMNKTKEFLR